MQLDGPSVVVADNLPPQQLLALDRKYAQLCRQSLLESSPQRESEPQEEIVASEVVEAQEERLQV